MRPVRFRSSARVAITLRVMSAAGLTSAFSTTPARSAPRHAERDGYFRRGTSLIEVMAAVLIMGVGVLGVMTLFPISILRSIQATQLTNATILSKRADAITDMYRLVTDDFIPQPEEGHETYCVIDPLGWHDLAPASLALANEYGNDGAAPVQYPTRVVQGQVVQPRFKNINVNNGRDILLGNVINPPSGVMAGIPLRRLSYAVAPVGNPFGNSTGLGPGPDGPYPGIGGNGLFPVPGAATDRDTVLAAVGLPDNFDTAFTGEPDASQTTAVKVGLLDTTYDLTDVASAVVPGTQVTLIDFTGRRSQVRTTADSIALMHTGGYWEITWSGALPASFYPPNGGVSEVRIEYPEPRYSWMLTVRKTGTAGGSVTKIDCVVFFNRPTGDPAQERVYVANQTQPGAIPNGPPTDRVQVDFSTAPKPPLKKGGWVFDPQNCVWYRVLEINDETATTADLVLNRQAEKWIRNLIIPEGVISVFPLRSRIDQNRLDAAR